MRLPGELNDDNSAWDTLLRVVTPFVEDGVEQLAETGCLAVLSQQTRVQYLGKTLPRHEIVYDRDITIDRAAHDVASGVVLLSGLSEDMLNDYLRASFDDEGACTAAADKIRKAAEEGYFVNLDGRVEGAAGVAAPVYDGAGNLVAAINYCGPTERFARSIDRAVSQVVTTAQLASDELKRRFHTRNSTREDVRNDT